LSHEQEVSLRLKVVALLARNGGGAQFRREVAQMIGYHERTIAGWEQRVREGKPVYRKRGCKAKDVPRARRQQLIEAMVGLGPFAGVPTLRGLFPDVAHRRIARMKQRLARVFTRRGRWRLRKLSWLRSGAIWATDFTQPKAGLWGGNDRLLVVRDLGSGAQLAAVPCKGEKAGPVRAVLLTLFLLFGAPLVLKSDNGGAFTAQRTQALLATHDVTPLLSPPYTPQYNGACERSGGCFKQRVEQLAWMAGRVSCWKRADLDEALWVANTTARPRGAKGPTPAQAFAARKPLAKREREAFKRSRARSITSALQTFQEENGRMPTCSEHEAINRKATQGALLKHGYLQLRRGRLSTPISAWKAAAIA
jgi:transposase InsO family protein